MPVLWTLRPRVHFRGIAVADEDPLASREQESQALLTRPAGSR